MSIRAAQVAVVTRDAISPPVGKKGTKPMKPFPSMILAVLSTVVVTGASAEGNPDESIDLGNRTLWNVTYKVRTAAGQERSSSWSNTVCERYATMAKLTANRQCENLHPGWDACKFSSVRAVGVCE